MLRLIFYFVFFEIWFYKANVIRNLDTIARYSNAECFRIMCRLYYDNEKVFLKSLIGHVWWIRAFGGGYHNAFFADAIVLLKIDLFTGS